MDGAESGVHLMALYRHRVFRASSILFVFLPILMLIVLIGQIAQIQLRLSRNGKIANQLVEGLEAQFPESGFDGVASYEREIVYIHVHNRLDESK
jgi:hypothetical protein